MIRRRFLLLAGWSIALGVRAQPKKAKLALVSLHSATMAADVDHLRAGLRERGWIEGKNLELEAQFTNGDVERTRALLRAAIAREVDVLIAWTTPTVQIARELTQTVPVVMISSDPLRAGLVDSLARPKGNLTGVSMSGPDLAGKRLQLLRELRPQVRKVAFVGSAKSAGAKGFASELDAAAKQLGLQLAVRMVDEAGAIDEALFLALKREGADAVIVQPLFTGAATRIAPLAVKANLALIGDYPTFAEAGALFTLGVDEHERVRRAAHYVDRILRGARPTELPIEQATTFQLVLNTATAKKIGWSVPKEILARADRVID